MYQLIEAAVTCAALVAVLAPLIAVFVLIGRTPSR